MQLLEDRIRRDGKVAPGNVLRVDSFINHQMDVELMEQIGQEFYRRFQQHPVTKVLTIEASGIRALKDLRGGQAQEVRQSRSRKQTPVQAARAACRICRERDL